eukprot:11514482-Ditylum_brightwellii.AAC.1
MVDEVKPSANLIVVVEPSANLIVVSSEDIMEPILVSIAVKVDDACNICCLNIAPMVSDNFVNFVLD